VFKRVTRLAARAQPCSDALAKGFWAAVSLRKCGFLSYRTRSSRSLRIDGDVPASRLFRRLSVPIEFRPGVRVTCPCPGPRSLSKFDWVHEQPESKQSYSRNVGECSSNIPAPAGRSQVPYPAAVC